MTEELKTAEQTAEQTKAPEIDYKAEYEKAMAEVERYKNGITKTNAEISKLKKDLADNLTKEQQAALERKNAEEEMKRKIAEYEKERTVNNYTKSFIASGYDVETATAMAKALPEGVSEDYFAAVKKFNEDTVAKAKAEAINAQPKLTAGDIPQADTESSVDALLRAKGII